MRRGLVIIMSVLPLFTAAQPAGKIVTLKDCYEMASAANALAGEKAALADVWQLKDKNISRGWLPTLDANGSFIYNSSVIDMGSALGALPIPGIAGAIKPLPHEQYRLTLDINQVIYDGGAIKSARALEKAELNVIEKQTESDIYKLRAQINTYFFNILLLDRQKELLSNFLELINKRILSLQAAINNGVLLKTDADVLRSEKIKIEQQLREYEIRRAALLKILAGITGKELDESSSLVLTLTSPELSDNILRPELEVFDLRKEQLGASTDLIDSRRMPKAFGFAILGYGNPPGNNFFKDEFAPYYIVGAGMKWNIFDWNKSKNEKQVISLQQGIIESRKQDMKDNLTRLLETKKSEIESLNSMLITDMELIEIRQRITAAAESQYSNGTITASDLLNEMISERQVLLNHELHKINLAMAQVEYLNISGKEIE
jgi:outer membrane protein TolC